MFDNMRAAVLAGAAELGAASDADAVAAVSAYHRMQSVHAAAELAAVADLHNRYEHRYDTGVDQFAVDRDDLLAAEVAAALNVSHGRALRLVGTAVTLRDRLPAVAAALAAGEIDMRLVNAIIERTVNVTAELIGEVDRRLAGLAGGWQRFSVGKIINLVDAVVAELDPDGVRYRRELAEANRHVTIAKSDEGKGTAGVWGDLLVEDGVALDTRLAAMARSVCTRDPRTADNRRADALGALARGDTALACQCDDPACPARRHAAGGPGGVLVHVIAHESTLAGKDDKPGFVERLGVIDADLTRRIAGAPRSPFLPKRPLTWEQQRSKHLRLARRAESMRRFCAEVERRYDPHRLGAGP